MPKKTGDVYGEPYKLLLYPAPPRRPEQHSVDMSIQALAFNLRVELCSTVRIKKSKRVLKETV